MPPTTHLHPRLRLRPPPRQPTLHLLRLNSTQPPSTAPPPARAYRPQTDAERAAYSKPDLPAPPAPRSRTRRLLSKYLNPFHEPTPPPPAPAEPLTPDPARGAAAAERVVREGMLEPRYRAAQRRWLGVIIGLVIAIGMTPEMWRRTVRGEKRREVPRPKGKGGEGEEGEG